MLGAGLDSRAWRLKMSDIFKDPTAVRPTSSKIGYFEIDFPEVFNYKLSVLADVSTVYMYVCMYTCMYIMTALKCMYV